MNTKTTLVLFFICVVFGAAVYFTNRSKENAAGTKAQDAEKALFDPKPEGTDRVELNFRDGRNYTFVREGTEEWMMEAPLVTPAARWEVDAIRDAALNVKYDKEYPKGASNRPSDELSGLDKPVVTVKLSKEGKVQAHLKIGNRLPIGAGSYIQQADSDTILVSKTDLGPSFDKSMDLLRSKQVMKFEVKNVQRAKVEGLRNFEMVQDSDQNWVLESPVRCRADKPKADSVVQPLSTLNIDRFVDDEPVSYKIYGLDKPRLKVTVETEATKPAKAQPGDPNTQPADTQPSKEAKTFVLLIGGATDTKNETYFARLESAPWVFAVRESTLKALTPEIAELREKGLIRVDVSKVKKLEAQTPGGALDLSLGEDGKWRFADQSEADGTAVTETLNALRDMQASEFVDTQSSVVLIDWNNPRARISVTQSGEVEPLTLLVGPPSATGKMVYVKNPAQESVAAVREEAVAQLLQPPAAYRNRSLASFKIENAALVNIERTSRPSVRLAKQGTIWRMEQPVVAPADQETVRTLLMDLSNLSAKRVAPTAEKADYGLDSPQISLTVTVQPPAAQPGAEVVGGASQPAAEGVDAENKVKMLEELLASQKKDAQAKPELLAMLEKQLADAKSAVVGAVTGAVADVVAAVTQPAADDREIQVLKDLIEYQKTNAAENPLATQMLKEMLAKKEGTAAQPATAAASQPAAPPPPIDIRIFLSQKDGTTYAMVPERDVIYVVENRVFEDADAEFKNRQIMQLPAENVVGMIFQSAGSTLTLRKAGEDWKLQEDPHLPVDKQKVTDIINGLRDLKTHRYVEYAAGDMGLYSLAGDDVDQVSFELKDGEPVVIKVAGAGPPGDADQSRYATRAGSEEVFLLKKDQASKFRQKLEDIEKKDAAFAP